MKKHFSLARMKSALRSIRDKATGPQMSMLGAHYYRRVASMEKIAAFGGYREYRAGNLQYGALCGRIARELGFESPGDQTYTIASISEPDEGGHSQWRLDDVVVQAIDELGWFDAMSVEEAQETDSPTDYRDVTETEREALSKARLGQGLFRADLIAIWGGCAVTNCSLGKILVASHIVPWALSTNKERLDPFNGLLLTPNLDRLFDRFLISFKADGSILLSKDLRVEERKVLGVSERSKLRFVRPAMLSYLARHRRLFLERVSAQAPD